MPRTVSGLPIDRKAALVAQPQPQTLPGVATNPEESRVDHGHHIEHHIEDLKLWLRFRHELLLHVEPLAGEIGACILQLGVLFSMWLINIATHHIQNADGHYWPTIVRWICNLRLAMVLVSLLVVHVRRLRREIARLCECAAEQPHKSSTGQSRRQCLVPQVGHMRRRSRQRPAISPAVVVR